MSINARGLPLAVVLVVSACASLALASAPASAAVEHKEIGGFTGAETPTGSFGSAGGVAVDGASGDVYVADETNNVVDKFTAAGKYICQITGAALPSTTECDPLGSTAPAEGFAFESPATLAVDNSLNPSDPSAGDVYVLDRGHGVVDKFGPSGQFLGEVGGPYPASPLGVAVDAEGNVWVESEQQGDSLIYRFDSEGSLAAGYPVETHQGAFDGFTVDSNNNLYVSVGEKIIELSATGQKQGEVETCQFCESGIATDLSSDDVFIDNQTHVVEYGPAKQPLADFAGSQLTSGGNGGIAVNPSTGQVYVTNVPDGRVYVFGRTPGPRVEPEPATEVKTTTAQVHAVVNPESEETTYRFEYGKGTNYGQSAPVTPVSAGSGNALLPAATELTGLEGGTEYHFRIAATSAAGTVFGADRSFRTLPVPVVEKRSVENLSAETADLEAVINPVGLPAKYRFEWGPSTTYGNIAPVPDGEIASGTAGVLVKQHIIGLKPGVLYHWRVTVTDEDGVTVTNDAVFIYNSPGSTLPDGRAYEMVTPVHKNGGLIGDVFEGLLPDISRTGSQVVASVIQCLPGAESCTGERSTVGTPYAFSRTSSGWTDRQLSPPASEFGVTTPLLDSAEGEGDLLFSVATNPLGGDDFYGRTGTGASVDIGPVTPPAEAGNASIVQYFATPDWRHVVWLSSKDVWKALDPTTGYTVYEDVPGSAEPRLVAVSGPFESHELIGVCGVEESAAAAGPAALSEDGNTYVFTLQQCAGGTGNNENVSIPEKEIFARVHNADASAHTVPISEPRALESAEPNERCTSARCLENTSPVPADKTANWRGAKFAGAFDDGDKVFFTSPQQLTDEATEDPVVADTAAGEHGCENIHAQSGCNLYEYDFTQPSGQRWVDVSAGAEGTVAGGPRVQGVMAASQDGSHVFFIARGVLTSQPNAQGQHATDGADNLYSYQRDAAHPNGQLAYVTEADDAVEWQAPDVTANVTPDGRYLVFLNHGQSTRDDTSVSGALQVFRYDSQTAELIRTSVGDEGFNNDGNRTSPTQCGTQFEVCAEDARIATPRTGLGLVGGLANPTVSDNGSYVFFQSPVGLTATAFDDKQIGTLEGQPVYAQNVYEWHEGHVYLISDGRDASLDRAQSGACGTLDPTSSVCLLGADPTGANVFFSTADSLVSEDTDGEMDYYDAHICTTESPCVQRTAATTECNEQACQGAGSPPPTPAAIGSLSGGGAGNLAPPTTPPAGKVRVAGHAIRDGRALMVTVVVSGKGRVTISGGGVTGVSHAVAKAGTYRLAIQLGPKVRAALHLRAKRKITLHLKVTFAPATGASVSVPLNVSAKG
jgi:DNA-binding beta-propeller fold protein YncE